MAATDREEDFKALRMDILEAIQSFRLELIENRKMVQRGFEDIAREQNTERRERLTLAADVKALKTTEQDCQQRLVRLEADGAARAILMRWLLTFGMLNAIGAVIVAALLIYMVTRLFSLAG